MRMKKDLWRKRGAEARSARSSDAREATTRGARRGSVSVARRPRSSTRRPSVARSSRCSISRTARPRCSPKAAPRSPTKSSPTCARSPKNSGESRDRSEERERTRSPRSSIASRTASRRSPKRPVRTRSSGTKKGRSAPTRASHHREGWAVFRTPQPVDHQHLVHLRRPEPKLPEVADGPTRHAPRARRLRLTDKRMSRLEVANEVDYCILCHDREKDSCRRGLIEAAPKRENPAEAAPGLRSAVDRRHGDHARVARPAASTSSIRTTPRDEPRLGRRRRSSRTRSASRSTAARSKRRSARCTRCVARGASIAALALVTIDNPMCPGTGHRICNDCMKALHLPEAGAGQHPADRDRRRSPTCCACPGASRSTTCSRAGTRSTCAARTRSRTTARTCSSSASGPAGYTLAHHLLNEGFGVVGDRRPQDRAASRRSSSATTTRSPSRSSATRISTQELDERIAPRVRRRQRVRHHRSLGQELPRSHRAQPLARARTSGCTAASASAARSTVARRVEARLRSRRDRGRRGQAHAHRRAERPRARHPSGVGLPDGAAADRRLQALVAREPPGAPARRS